MGTSRSRSAAPEKNKYPTGFARGSNVQHEEATKKRGAACGARNSGKQIERKTLGSGLNAGNIGAEIDVIQPPLPAQTHAPIAIRFAFGVGVRRLGAGPLDYFLACLCRRIRALRRWVFAIDALPQIFGLTPHSNEL